MYWFEELALWVLDSRFVPLPIGVIGGAVVICNVATREAAIEAVSTGITNLIDHVAGALSVGINPLDECKSLLKVVPLHPSMDSLLKNPVLSEDPEECLEVIQADEKSVKKRVNRHSRGTFASHAAIACKMHFGVVPLPTRANLTVATRFVANYCQERHVVPAHARGICDAAIPLIFTPDRGDIGVMAALNHRESQIRRVAVREASNLCTPSMELVQNPFCGSAWRRMGRVLVGYEDYTSFQFSK
nr:P27 [Japanese iris necrotic ring virus]